MSVPNGGGGITMEAMQRHLDSVFIGFRPGDPTAGMPPATMPLPSVPPSAALKYIDLRDLSMAQLSAEALATQPPDMFGALLPDPPGVPSNRIAYITGQAPKNPGAAQAAGGAAAQPRQQQAAPAPKPNQQISEGATVVVLSRYLPPRPGAAAAAGAGSNVAANGQVPVPWAELGLTKGGPKMGGAECDLQLLWKLAYLEGAGYEGLTYAGGWPAIAVRMGVDLKRITNAGFIVQQWYRRFLLPLERHLERQGGKKAASVGLDAGMEDAGPAIADGA